MAQGVCAEPEKERERHFTEMIYTNDPTGKCYFIKEEMMNYGI